MLELRSISKTFWLEKGIFLSKTSPCEALKNITMKFHKGEIIAVVGESGSGKTTLARIAAGLLKADRGEVLINGRNAGDYPRNLRAAAVGIAFQDPVASLNPARSIGRVLKEVIKYRAKVAMNIPDEFKSVEGLLKVFSLDKKTSFVRPGSLSGGECQRVALARSFAMFPEYLILDEVTSSLDVSTASGLLNLFKELNKKYGTTLIFITHDLLLAEIISERIYVMKSGSVVEEGQTQEVFEMPRTEYARKLKEAII